MERALRYIHNFSVLNYDKNVGCEMEQITISNTSIIHSIYMETIERFHLSILFTQSIQSSICKLYRPGVRRNHTKQIQNQHGWLHH